MLTSYSPAPVHCQCIQHWALSDSMVATPNRVVPLHGFTIGHRAHLLFSTLPAGLLAVSLDNVADDCQLCPNTSVTRIQWRGLVRVRPDSRPPVPAGSRSGPMPAGAEIHATRVPTLANGAVPSVFRTVHIQMC